ncbi:MAG TPA: biotin/lipoyl-binding protein [Bacteroidales bacterium]|nr:biotin/lipoyl-binding protein [Bacteroidales bacterium]HPS18105.1 biotin/lipoyl-binding protein [Bacteroidales bacterium]
MKKFKFKIQGNQYDVEIQNIEDNIAKIEVNGILYEVEVDKNLQPTKTPKLIRTDSVPSTDSNKSTAKTSNPSDPKGGGTIKAPLPGVILSIHVNVGDSIKIGQKLIILEAMKMENNINSDKEGTVKAIKISKGDSVMEGDTLIIID